MHGLDVHLIYVLITSLQTLVTFDLLQLFRGRGVDPLQQQVVLIVFFDNAEGACRMLFDIFLDFFDRLSVFLLACNISLLLVRHAVLKPQGLSAF